MSDPAVPASAGSPAIPRRRRSRCRAVLAAVAAVSVWVAGIAAPSAQAAWTPGSVSYPANGANGIDVAVDGTVWLVSAFDNRVRAYSPHGLLLRTIGGFGTGPGQFDLPSALTVAPNGDIYVTDVGSARVQRFASSGAYVSAYGSSALLSNPRGVDVDATGNVYVADYERGLHKFGPGGGLVRSYPAITRGFAVAVAADGSIWASDFGPQPNVVRQLDADTGAVLSTLGGFGQPTDIEVDAAGRVHVLDFNSATVRTYTAGGVLGETSGPYPSAIAFAIDAFGRLFVSSGSQASVKNPVPVTVTQHIGPSGNPSVPASYATASAGQPTSTVDFDGDGFDGLAPHTFTPIPPDHYASLGLRLVGLDARSVGSQPWAHSPPIGAWQTGFSLPAQPYRFEFATPVSSVGWFANDVEGAIGVTVLLSGGGREFFTIAATGNAATGFHGFTAAANVITAVELHSFDYHIIDDLRFGRRAVAPTAVDDTASLDEDQTVSIDALANDTDPGGSALTIVAATSPNGAATVTGNRVEFSPTADTCGAQTVSYTVRNTSGLTANASIAVDTRCVADAPVAGDDTATMAQGGDLEVAVLGNDSDPDGPTALTVTSATSDVGTVSTNGTTVTLTTPITFCGTANVGYTVSDGGLTDAGTLTVDVTCLDADGDGVADAIADGTRKFRDVIGGQPDTFGRITVVPPGFALLVEDAPDPSGVRIRVAGSGSARAELSVCGFTLRLVAGSDLEVTCGSIRLFVRAGQADVALPGDAHVTVPAGAGTTVASMGPDRYAVSDVIGTGTTLTVGGRTVPVTGSATFATWAFTGFMNPVVNLPAMGTYNAGRNIPLKWRLVGTDGRAVTDLTSASFTVTPVHCTTFAANGAAEGVDAQSLLVHEGDGTYRINWKTGKAFAGTCRLLRLDLGEGITRDARFSFR